MSEQVLAFTGRVLKFDQIDLLQVGHTIQLEGAIWVGNGEMYILPFPDSNVIGTQVNFCQLTAAEWERFLNQSDVLDIQGQGPMAKAILRKSQRLIDQVMAWEVFRRDGYVCRYCGRNAPLTVDHVILWEAGGATVVDNLLSSCRRCNKLRGSTEYQRWITSRDYERVSGSLTSEARSLNVAVIERLDELSKIVAKPRSR